MMQKKVYSSNPARPTGLIYLVDNNNTFQICHNYRGLRIECLFSNTGLNVSWKSQTFRGWFANE